METEQVIGAELSGTERLLWSGRPRQGVIFRASDIFLIPFSLLWCGFALFWEIGVIKSGAPFFFMLWGIPFILVGLYFVFGRFLYDSYQRQKTFYAVTTERIVIVSGISKRTVKSLSLRTLTDLSMTERSDRSGTIVFGPSNPMASWAGNFTWPGMSQGAPVFDTIDNAKQVYDTIRSAQREIH